jgi:tRNA(fMet)-specific endonuclease VapC
MSDLLLDTDALSHLLRGTDRGGLVAKIAAVPPDRRFLSAVALGELLYGLERRGLEALRRRLEREFLARIEVLPFDEAAAREYARVRVELERARMPLAEADLQIAAIALSRGLRLLTGNGKHFRRIEGLELEEF